MPHIAPRRLRLLPTFTPSENVDPRVYGRIFGPEVAQKCVLDPINDRQGEQVDDWPILSEEHGRIAANVP